MTGLWIPSLNLAREPASCRKSTGHCCPHRSAGPDDILEDAVYGVLVKDAEIPVGVDIHFERFEFETGFVGHVVQRDGAEIRQICFGANRRVLWNFDGNFISLILIREGFDLGQGGSDAASGMPLIVA